ncbi:MAG: TolC family protein [Myxococcales bacterium]|nr:TolC family protein [Myxococcales bacterium]
MSARAARTGRALGLAVVAFALTARAEPLTLAAALDRAHASHPELRAAGHQVDAAEQDRAALRSRLFPSLDAEASVLVWDDAQTLSLGGGGGAPVDLPPPTTPYEQIVAQVAGALGGDTTVRDQVTGSVALTLTQPLTPIIGILAASAVADRDIDALRATRTATAGRVELQVVEAFFRVMQADAVAATAEDGVRALEARAETAAAFEQAGLFGRNDVLKVQVAVLSARQNALAARHDLRRARAALGLAMGVDGPIEGPLAAELPGWAAAKVADSADEALARRPEVAAARARVAQAEQGVKARRTAYIPDVSLLANYTRTEGSSLQQADAFYAGAALRWNLFQWGGTARRVDQAEALARAAAEGEARLEQSVAFEVTQARLALRTADEGLEVAQAAVEQATEAARLERARFDAQKSTSTDVLDAEVALTRAQRRLETARFDRVIAQARLRWATGLPLQENRG